MPQLYNPANLTTITEIQYAVGTTGDRFFIPSNSDEHGGGDGDMADQLAQCQVMSPKGVEKVA